MNLNILIIDDEESILDTMQWHLEDQGHEVQTASEPLLCDAYREQECRKEVACADLLFIDYNLPRMSGLELVESMAVRGCKIPSQNKTIMSGDIGSIDIDKALVLGCHVEQKPLRFSRVDEIVEVCKAGLATD